MIHQFFKKYNHTCYIVLMTYTCYFLIKKSNLWLKKTSQQTKAITYLHLHKVVPRFESNVNLEMCHLQ